MRKPGMTRALTSAGVVLFLALGAASPQSAHQFPDMSADMISSADGHEMVGHFYTSKGRIRVENQRSVIIMDPLHGSGWMLRPAQKVAMDMSSQMNSAMAAQMGAKALLDANNPCSTLQGSTCRKLGRESMNGRQTQRWEVKEPDGSTVQLWIDPKLSLAVKTQTPNYTGEFRNIKEGPQSDSLFEVPADFRKVAAPGSVPQQR